MQMKTLVVTGLSAGAVAAVAVGGVTLGQFLSGGGSQPEDVLPADTIGFARVDLDPSAGQKLNAVRLLRKFPSVRLQGQDDLKATVGEMLLEDNDFGLDYDKDVAPWLGDRAAVAALPAPARSTEPVAPVVVLQFTDQEKMTASLEKARKAIAKKPWFGYGATPRVAPESGPESAPLEKTQRVPFGYATRDGYVFLAETEKQARAAAGAEQVLADDPDFAADADALDVGDQVAVGWVDVGAAYDAVPEDERKQFAEQLGATHPSGRMVAGLHVEPSYVELTGQAHGLQPTDVTSAAAGFPGTGLVKDFPQGTDVAFSVTNLGPAAAELWKYFGEDPYLGLDDEADQMGLRMPGDLEAVLGKEVGVGVLLDGDVDDWDVDAVARARTDHSARAVEVLRTLSEVEPDAVVRPTSDGWVLATSDRLAAEAADGKDGLGSDPQFGQAVRDADDANGLLYVDIASLVDFFLSPDDPDYQDFRPLAAFGMSSTGDGKDGEFTARLLFR